MQEEERCQQSEGDGPDPVHEHPVVHEHTGDDQAGHIGRQHRFAAGRGREASESEEHHKEELHLGLTHTVAEAVDHKARCPREDQQRGDGHRHEDEKQPAVGGEQPAESENGAEIGHKAGRQDEFAEILAVQARFDHDGVHDGDRRRAQCNAADLRPVQGPVEDELAEPEGPQERQQERHDADHQACLPMSSQGDRIDLSSCEEGQHEGPGTGKEGGDVGLLDMFLEAWNVAEHGTDEDLDERDREPELDADHRRQQRHGEPDGKDVIGIHAYP